MDIFIPKSRRDLRRGGRVWGNVKNVRFINCNGALVSDNKAVIGYVKPFGFAAVTVELD